MSYASEIREIWKKYVSITHIGDTCVDVGITITRCKSVDQKNLYDNMFTPRINMSLRSFCNFEAHALQSYKKILKTCLLRLNRLVEMNQTY